MRQPPSISQNSRRSGSRSAIPGTAVLSAAILLIAGLGVAPVQGGTQDDAIAMWGKRYQQAYQDLRYGSTFEKIRAARLMGAHRKSRYIRPLGKELLRELDRPAYRKVPTNDPYVKSEIAWAMGEIGHKQAVPDLLQAIALTMTIAEEEFAVTVQKRTEALKASEEAATARGEDAAEPERIKPVTLTRERPGPFLVEGYTFPYSPDMMWSKADEFKSIPAPDDTAEDHRIRLMGANYLNLLRALFIALGEIGDESAIEAIKAADGQTDIPGVSSYLTNDIPVVRGFASIALGKIATKKAYALIDQHYPNETVDSIKVRIAHSVLGSDKSRTEYYDEMLRYLAINDDRVRYLAAVGMRELAMGESLDHLKDAYSIEHDPVIRKVLQEAIHNAEVDSIIPVNY